MNKQLVIPIIAGFAALALILPSCDKENCNPGGGNDCICTMEYAPVCGSDGITYGNACEARCNGITNYTPGECKSD